MVRGWEAIQLCSVVILINTTRLNKSYKPTDCALCHSVAVLHVCSSVVSYSVALLHDVSVISLSVAVLLTSL